MLGFFDLIAVLVVCGTVAFVTVVIASVVKMRGLATSLAVDPQKAPEKTPPSPLA